MFLKLTSMVVIGLLFCLSQAARALDDGATQVTVTVFNDGNVSNDVLARAERRATTILQAAHVRVTWLHTAEGASSSSRSALGRKPCPATDFSIRVVRHSLALPESIFGVSFLGQDGSGRYSDVFYATAYRLSESGRLNLGELLGHVVAHELGHLLLGSNAHSSLGIMRPHWSAEELQSLRMGKLLFTREQSQLMKEKIHKATASADSLPRATFIARQ
jgi:hypothetical protein